jgi:hypothetical protein
LWESEKDFQRRSRAIWRDPEKEVRILHQMSQKTDARRSSLVEKRASSIAQRGGMQVALASAHLN